MVPASGWLVQLLPFYQPLTPSLSLLTMLTQSGKHFRTEAIIDSGGPRQSIGASYQQHSCACMLGQDAASLLSLGTACSGQQTSKESQWKSQHRADQVGCATTCHS